jgi:hypothetical protein
LIGVVLSDTTHEMCGNLGVYSGSHHILEQFFNQNGFGVKGALPYITHYNGAPQFDQGCVPLLIVELDR